MTLLEIAPTLVEEISPQDAWKLLAETPGAVLVDVRSRPEWSFAGLPDLSRIDREVWTVEWQTWPDMTPNLGFLSDLDDHMGIERPARMFMMCRMGSRAMSAARAVAKQMFDRGRPLQITNIAGGFEGDHDTAGQRGKINGWKAAGLPWRQA